MELELEKNLKVLTEGIEFKVDKYLTYEDVLDLLKKVYRKQVKRYHPDQVNFSGLTLEELRQKYDAVSYAYYQLIKLINQDRDNFVKTFNKKYFNMFSSAKDKKNGAHYARTLDKTKNPRYSFKILKFTSSSMIIDVYFSNGDLYKSFTFSQNRETVLGKYIYKYFISINANDVNDYIYTSTIFSATNILDIIRFYESSYADECSKNYSYLGLEFLADNIVSPDILMDLYLNWNGYLGELSFNNDKNEFSLVYSKRNHELIQNSLSLQNYLRFFVSDWKGREINTEYTSYRNIKK